MVFYEGIIILNESSSTPNIDLVLLEDDDNSTDNDENLSESDKESIFQKLKDSLTNLKNKFQAEYAALKIQLNSGKNNKIITFIKWLGSLIYRMGAHLLKAILKLYKKLFDWMRAKIPGLNTIVVKIKNFFSKEENKVNDFNVADVKLTITDVIGIAVVTFVIVGTLGYIIKKISGKFKNKNNGEDNTNNNTNPSEIQDQILVVSTKPLILTESKDNERKTFVDKLPGALSSLINFLKNIKDKTAEVFIGILATVLAVGVFVVLLVVTRKWGCKALQYGLEIDRDGRVDSISGMEKVKYVGSKTFLGVANTLAKKLNITIYTECPGITYKSDKGYYLE